MGNVQNALGKCGAWQSVGDQTVIGAGEFNTTVIKLWQVKHTNQRLANITQGYPTRWVVWGVGNGKQGSELPGWQNIVRLTKSSFGGGEDNPEPH